MNLENFLLQAIFFIPPFLLAISVHESAHAYIAYRFGDPTARDLGRITLNPVPHIDLIGFIALFLVHFGWAKPVPVNHLNLKNPIKDNLWIALAGPVSNLILAVVSALVFRVVAPFISDSAVGAFIVTMIVASVTLNLVLMVFNLFPIPPLDGFHILQGVVPYNIYLQLEKIQTAGPMILLAIILIGNFSGVSIFGYIFNPIVSVLGGMLLGTPIHW